MVVRAIVAVAAGISALVASSTADAGSLEDCGQRVIRDWYSGGRVDKLYPLPCYRAAIRALPDDVLQYTDAGAAIERALEHARHRGISASRATTDEAHVTATSPAPRADAERRSSPPPATVPRRAHPPARLANGSSEASPEATPAPGIPYPLIALGALSAVLLASGVVAGLAHRRR